SGWFGAFFTIAGIAIGAYYSLQGIAQFYSLFFILFVLPFNMVYIFHNAMKFKLKPLLLFWLPIILLSLGIWLSCYFEHSGAKLILLLMMLVNLIVSSKNEIKSIMSILMSKISSNRSSSY